MKILITLLLSVLFNSKCFPQSFLDSLLYDGSMVRFEKTISHTDLKDELFMKGRMWFAETFKSAKNVIQLEDKTEGIIVGKGITVAGYYRYGVKKNTLFHRKDDFGAATNNIQFTIKMFFKDNGVKVSISDIVIMDDYYDFRNRGYEKAIIDSANKLLSGKIKQQAEGRTIIELLKATNDSINEILVSIENKMLKPKEGF